MVAGIHHELIGAGEPLVLLNGAMMTTASWTKYGSTLSREFRCVLHDFRGQLRSSRPRAPYSMSMHVDDLRRLLDELGIARSHIIGTSYGGEVGMMFAGAHPGRVRSLTVIASVARADDQLRQAVAEWSAMARHSPERLWDASLKHNYSPAFVAANPVFIAAARGRVNALPRQWFDALADLCDAAAHVDVDLAAIRCPTLVVCGEKDVLKPPERSREIADGIAGAKLMVIPAAGHAVVVEKADEVISAVLEFLRSLTEV